MLSIVKQSAVYQCKERKKKHNWNELQKLTPNNIREKNVKTTIA